MKGQFVEVVKRKIPLDKIASVSLRYSAYTHSTPHNPPTPLLTIHPLHTPHSPFQDDFLVLHVRDEYDSVFETVLKTEFLTLLSEKYQTITSSRLSFTFNRRFVLPLTR